jgi:hypothetical protein
MPMGLKARKLACDHHEVAFVMRRFSSRRQRLAESFLAERLHTARAYDRIAGYFSSSMLEVAGEALESMCGPVRVVCNSELDVRDVDTARAASYAVRREWCASHPERFDSPQARDRFARLYDFLRSGTLQIRVLPSDKFGLVHGKAGVITLADGRQTCFMGSANETANAWTLNYELIWEDDAPEAIQEVQEEFDALWHSTYAVPLAEFVVEDIGRLARRTIVPCVETWRDQPEPAAPLIETPVYRQKCGLVEAWDLLNVLAKTNEHVLGNGWSHWRHAEQALDLVMGQRSLPTDELELWSWIRNPLPPSTEGHDFDILRRSLCLSDDIAVAPGNDWMTLKASDKNRT